METSIIARGLVFIGAVALLGGCFSPDYGAGGFACEKGGCPSGLVCVQEPSGAVCRQAGAATDGGGTSTDGTISDARGADGPSPDAGSLADGSLPADAAADQGVRDGATPADGSGRDGGTPADGTAPDSGPPGPPCSDLKIVSYSLANKVSPQPFDLAVDSMGGAHVLFVADYTNALYHATLPATASAWNSTYVGGFPLTTAEGVAAAVGRDADGGREFLHIVYARNDSNGVPRPWRRALPIGDTVWTESVQMSTWLRATQGLDIGAYQERIYVAGAGQYATPKNEILPGTSFWRLEYDGDPPQWKHINLGTAPSDTFVDPRVGVGPTRWGHATFRLAIANQESWIINSSAHPNRESDSEHIAAYQQSAAPAPVAMDRNGTMHVAHVSAAAQQTSGALGYTIWDRTSSPASSPVANADAASRSLDLVLTGTDERPHLSYVVAGGTESTLNLRYRDPSGSWSAAKEVGPANAAATRLAVSPTGDLLHLVYHYGSYLYHRTCPLPLR